MADHDDEFIVIICQRSQKLRYIDLMFNIQIGRRFIQNHYFSVLDHSSGQGYLLMLACGKRD
ncbi:hypothetical protein AUQ37_09105 [Candidatus Methanomethylophilus sp. 1R26]|nr:hypothetical protein AUQ37_09105 [Candidatus Methanomethylophilus sp. 1R26]